jgi:hypothetical protein
VGMSNAGSSRSAVSKQPVSMGTAPTAASSGASRRNGTRRAASGRHDAGPDTVITPSIAGLSLNEC